MAQDAAGAGTGTGGEEAERGAAGGEEEGVGEEEGELRGGGGGAGEEGVEAEAGADVVARGGDGVNGGPGIVRIGEIAPAERCGSFSGNKGPGRKGLRNKALFRSRSSSLPGLMGANCRVGYSIRA